MRNVWKGLIVGGLTGVTAGIVLDSANRASRKAAAVGGQVRDHAPDAVRWLHSLTDKAGEWLHDSDFPEHVRETADRLKESDAVRRLADTSADIVSTVTDSTTSRTG